MIFIQIFYILQYKFQLFQLFNYFKVNCCSDIAPLYVKNANSHLAGCHGYFAEIHRSNWWLPLKWSIEVIVSAKEGELITNTPGFSHLISKLCDFR